MPTTQTVVTREADLLADPDSMVRQHQTRLADACALLDPVAERMLAEEGLGADLEGWPEY